MKGQDSGRTASSVALTSRALHSSYSPRSRCQSRWFGVTFVSSALLLRGFTYLRLKLDNSSRNASEESLADAIGVPRLPPVKRCGKVGKRRSEAIVVTVLFPSEPLTRNTFSRVSLKNMSVSDVTVVLSVRVSFSRLSDGEVNITSSLIPSKALLPQISSTLPSCVTFTELLFLTVILRIKSHSRIAPSTAEVVVP